LDASRGGKRSVTIASVQSDKQDYSNVQPDLSVEDRYYTKAEYMKLSPEKKAGLQEKRKRRGHRPGDKTSRVNKKRRTGNNKNNNNISNRTIKALVSALTAKLSSDDSPEDTQNDDPGTDAPDSAASPSRNSIRNRDNPALQRRN